MPRKEEVVAEVSGVSPATIKRWPKRRRETGGVEAKPIPGRPPVKGAALRGWLLGQPEGNPDLLALEERCEAFEEERGVRVWTATMRAAPPPACRAVGRSKKVARSPG